MQSCVTSNLIIPSYLTSTTKSFQSHLHLTRVQEHLLQDVLLQDDLPQYYLPYGYFTLQDVYSMDVIPKGTFHFRLDYSTVFQIRGLFHLRINYSRIFSLSDYLLQNSILKKKREKFPRGIEPGTPSMLARGLTSIPTVLDERNGQKSYK